MKTKLALVVAALFAAVSASAQSVPNSGNTGNVTPSAPPAQPTAREKIAASRAQLEQSKADLARANADFQKIMDSRPQDTSGGINPFDPNWKPSKAETIVIVVPVDQKSAQKTVALRVEDLLLLVPQQWALDGASALKPAPTPPGTRLKAKVDKVVDDTTVLVAVTEGKTLSQKAVKFLATKTRRPGDVVDVEVLPANAPLYVDGIKVPQFNEIVSLPRPGRGVIMDWIRMGRPLAVTRIENREGGAVLATYQLTWK